MKSIKEKQEKIINELMNLIDGEIKHETRYQLIQQLQMFVDSMRTLEAAKHEEAVTENIYG